MFWNMAYEYEMWTFELPSRRYNFYLWKLSINPEKRGSSKAGMLFFSQKIMNMFELVYSFGMHGGIF